MINQENQLYRKIIKNTEQLSRSQKIVASYVLENGREVAFMTAQELADKVGVSLATVVRTAVSMGFGSYQNLRDKLKDIIKTTSNPTWQELEESWSKPYKEDYFETVVRENMEALKSLLTSARSTSISKAVDLIDSADSIYIIGSRSSRAPALSLYYAFQQFTRNANLLATMGEDDLYENLLRIGSRDVLVAISNGYPYYAMQTIKAVQFVSEKGIPVILLTDHPANPCIISSRIVILVPACKGHFSLVPLNTVLESFVVGLGMRHSDRSVDKLRALWQILIDNGITLGKENINE